MVRLSVQISDVVASDFAGKLRAAARLGIHNVEASDVIDGVRLDRMSGEEAERLRDLLIDENMRLVLLSTEISPLDHEALLRLYRRALALDVEGILVSPRRSEDLTEMNRLSRSFSIPFYVENRAEGTYPDENALYAAARQGARVAFNPLEIVKTGRHPFFHAYYASKIKSDIGFLRICDGLYRTGETTDLGHGCCEVKELTSIMLSRIYPGYFSFVPYRPDMDLAAYRNCLEAFKGMLKRM